MTRGQSAGQLGSSVPRRRDGSGPCFPLQLRQRLSAAKRMLLMRSSWSPPPPIKIAARWGAGALAGLVWTGVATLTSAVWSGPAAAAPFCLQNQGMTPQCIYYDPTICQRDAQKQNAQCGTNPREVKVTAGTGQYCLVTQERVSVCHYQDLGSCLSAARNQHAVCTGSPNRSPTRPPDPYSRQGY